MLRLPGQADWISYVKCPAEPVCDQQFFFKKDFYCVYFFHKHILEALFDQGKSYNIGKYWNTASLNHKVISSLKIALILLQLLLSFWYSHFTLSASTSPILFYYSLEGFQLARRQQELDNDHRYTYSKCHGPVAHRHSA